ncbi:hypothetical protein [Microbulbifer halophilus]
MPSPCECYLVRLFRVVGMAGVLTTIDIKVGVFNELSIDDARMGCRA